MCDMGYLCDNFCLPRPLCSRLRPDVATDRRQTSDVRRQTDVRSASSLNAPTLGAGHNNLPFYSKNICSALIFFSGCWSGCLWELGDLA